MSVEERKKQMTSNIVKDVKDEHDNVIYVVPCFKKKK